LYVGRSCADRCEGFAIVLFFVAMRYAISAIAAWAVYTLFAAGVDEGLARWLRALAFMI
jgi:hypothetical protein